MQQVVQQVKNGTTSVQTLPDPIARPGQVLIANQRSVISAGTERMVLELTRKSLLGKARERPDHVRRVLEKMRQEGIFQTLEQVFRKLDEPMSMGYCSAGVVLAVGADVQGIRPGDRVASNGPHAEVVCVPQHLCALIPEKVSYDHAAFAVLGAIALQGVRLAKTALGETAFVIGLGLLGQLAVALLKAQGCRVLATDLDAGRCLLAKTMGADLAEPGLSAVDVARLSQGLGADVVVITASTASNGPVELAAEAVRKKGRIVAIGAVGMNLPRRPLYFKEAEFVVSSSYGPGRYDANYEERGQDYPPAYVRWTEQRNMQAVLDLMASGKLSVEPLISHRFHLHDAVKAYDLIEAADSSSMGILLDYPDDVERKPISTIKLRAPATEKVVVGSLGGGQFARAVLFPKLQHMKGVALHTLCSAGGLASATAADRYGFAQVSTDEAAVLNDPAINTVLVLTRHDQHAAQVMKALEAGKHVFVEKPLALSVHELALVESQITDHKSQILMVGFNRRFAPAVQLVKKHFACVTEPLAVSIRFNAGDIPADHWTQDTATGGGRIVGEACHAIDLATYLHGSPPVRVFAESVGGAEASGITEDRCFITLRHANGAISSIGYLAGGDRAFPKERIEMIGGGCVGVVDDYRTVTLVADGKTRTEKLSGQDKGHGLELEAFVRAVQEGLSAPIAWQDLRSITLASILAAQSIREGVPFDV